MDFLQAAWESGAQFLILETTDGPLTVTAHNENPAEAMRKARENKEVGQ